MKLQINSARTGWQWVILGIKTFFRQPLALSGLFLLFVVVTALLKLLPWIGSLLAMVTVPAATVGLMAAAQQAHAGKFPMPGMLFCALRVSPPRLRAMLILGALYAAGVVLVLAIAALLDGGILASWMLGFGHIDIDPSNEGNLQASALLATTLYVPLSMCFWYAPALVHWHGISPMKSLFFSAAASARNFSAFLVFSLGWAAVFTAVCFLIVIALGLTGSVAASPAALLPCALFFTAMFFTSIYFTYRDSFTDDTALIPPTER